MGIRKPRYDLNAALGKIENFSEIFHQVLVGFPVNRQGLYFNAKGAVRINSNTVHLAFGLHEAMNLHVEEIK